MLPAKKLFPQPARGCPILRVLFAKGGKRSHRTIRTLQGKGPLFLPYKLEQAAKTLRFAPGLGKGTSSTRAVNSDRSMAASSRWGNAAREKTFSAACQKVPHPSRAFREGWDSTRIYPALERPYPLGYTRLARMPPLRSHLSPPEPPVYPELPQPGRARLLAVPISQPISQPKMRALAPGGRESQGQWREQSAARNMR